VATRNRQHRTRWTLRSPANPGPNTLIIDRYEKFETRRRCASGAVPRDDRATDGDAACRTRHRERALGAHRPRRHGASGLRSGWYQACQRCGSGGFPAVASFRRNRSHSGSRSENWRGDFSLPVGVYIRAANLPTQSLCAAARCGRQGQAVRVLRSRAAGWRRALNVPARRNAFALQGN
jgi:hypothetical protein